MDILLPGNSVNYSVTVQNESVAVDETLPKNNDNAYSEEILLNMFNDHQLRLQLPAIVYTGVMMILGLPGNVIVCYVYFFKWRRSTSRIFILGIAFLDLFNCATTLPMEIFILRYSIMLDNPMLCKITRFSTYFMNAAAATILVGIAVDRFQHICRPHSRGLSSRASLYICLASLVSALMFTWPALVLYGTRQLDFGRITGYACLLQNKFDKTWYPIVYLAVMMFVTMALFVVLAVLYILIGLKIYQHRQAKQKKCTHMQSAENGTQVDPDSGSHYKIAKPSTVDEETEHDDNEQVNGNNSRIDAAANYNNIEPQESEKVDNETFLSPDNINEIKTVSSKDSKIKGNTSSRNCSNSDSSPGYMNQNNGDLTVGSLPRNASSVSTRETRSSTTTARSTSRSSIRRSVKYLWVRGASSFRRSDRNKCTKCGITVRIGRSTLMLFLITIAYVLSFVPFYTIVILRQADTSFVHKLSPNGSMMYHLFLRSYLLSSAINPFIYCFCNKQFREYCKDLFFHVILRRPQSDAMIKMQRRF